MFVQVIQGHVTDPDAIHEAFESWQHDLAPGADGWLGTTAGVTPEGDLIALAKFDSPEAAQRNSHRPEQHRWWMETSRLFDGDATFTDCEEVDTFLDGGTEQARFVQVMQGRSSDPHRMLEVNHRTEPVLHEHRPEILGGTAAVHESGDRLTEVVYFSSEAEAREGERKQPPPELSQMMESEPQLFTDVRYFDLPEPWIYSPSR